MRCFRFTWGPPDLAKAVRLLDPRHVTRAPRRHCKHRRQESVRACSAELKVALQTPGSECVLLRRYDEHQQTFTSWYCLRKPVNATVAVGRTTDGAVVLRYDASGSKQCARLCIERRHVPAADRQTCFVKVVECITDDGKQYRTLSVAAMPKAAYDAMRDGAELPDNIMLKLNTVAACKGPRSQECMALWAILRGEGLACIDIVH